MNLISRPTNLSVLSSLLLQFSMADRQCGWHVAMGPGIAGRCRARRRQPAHPLQTALGGRRPGAAAPPGCHASTPLLTGLQQFDPPIDGLRPGQWAQLDDGGRMARQRAVGQLLVVLKC
jgi:hypothetical protein